MYNQHVRPRNFKVGMLVLCNTREVRSNLPIPKFAPTWEVLEHSFEETTSLDSN